MLELEVEADDADDRAVPGVYNTNGNPATDREPHVKPRPEATSQRNAQQRTTHLCPITEYRQQATHRAPTECQKQIVCRM